MASRNLDLTGQGPNPFAGGHGGDSQYAMREYTRGGGNGQWDGVANATLAPFRFERDALSAHVPTMSLEKTLTQLRTKAELTEHRATKMLALNHFAVIKNITKELSIFTNKVGDMVKGITADPAQATAMKMKFFEDNSRELLKFLAENLEEAQTILGRNPVTGAKYGAPNISFSM